MTWRCAACGYTGNLRHRRHCTRLDDFELELLDRACWWLDDSYKPEPKPTDPDDSRYDGSNQGDLFA